MSLLMRASIGVLLIAAAACCILRCFTTNRSTGLTVSTSPFPGRPDCYSLEMHCSDGRTSNEFVNGSLKRLEIYTPNIELPQLHIYRPDKGLAWSALPGSTVLQELPESSEAAAAARSIDSLIVWTSEGLAVIDGCECIRFVGTYQLPAGRAHEVSFIDATNGLPFRQVTYDRMGKQSLVNERKAFSLQPPDLGLFEVPKGYTVARTQAGTR